MIDKILENVLQDNLREDNVAILFSGGIDSISLAFAAHRLGKKLHCYTMYVDGVVSKDAQNAIDVANKFGWEMTLIDVPTDNLFEDFKYLINHYGCKKKTQVECAWPFLYVYPHIKEREIISGLGADGLQGSSKKVCLHFKEPKELFDSYRRDYMNPEITPNPGGILQHEQLCEEFEKKFVAPYHDERVIDYFMQYDWYDLNRPYPKNKVIDAFPEFKQIKVRRHENLQLAAGIPSHFEKLLDNPEVNVYNRRRVMDLVRDWNDMGETLF